MNTTMTVSALHCVLILATFLTTSVSANEWECGERSNLPLVGRNYCAAGDFRQTEINLEKVLNKLIEKYQAAAGDTSALIDSQTEFEMYRDNECAVENKQLEDKPYYPMMVAQCKTRLTNLRIAELNALQP